MPARAVSQTFHTSRGSDRCAHPPPTTTISVRLGRTVPVSEAIRYVDGRQVRVWFPSGSISPRVEIEADRTVLHARIRRAFPLTEPTRYLSVQDGAGHEVCMIRNPDKSDPESRQAIERALDRRYFTPRIGAITYLKQEAGMWRFRVTTHRGDGEFFVRNWRESAVEISPNRWLIFAVDGRRFEIPDLESLDDKSRRLVEQLF